MRYDLPPKCLADGSVRPDDCCAASRAVAPRAQFVDDFNGATDPDGPARPERVGIRTGDGTATMAFRQGGEGYASIRVDATTDRRGIWWALIKHKVSEHMDLQQLGRPEMELRIEARIRVSHAPRRVNLHLNTQTDDGLPQSPDGVRHPRQRYLAHDQHDYS